MSRVRAADEGWSMLRVGANTSSSLEIPTLPTGVVTSAGQVRFALGMHGEPRLLLPISIKDTIPAATPGPLSIAEANYSSNGQVYRFLDLECGNDELNKVFAEVVDEILVRIESGQSVIQAANSTIEDFRRLLLPPDNAEVTNARISGLIGELIVLNRLLDKSSQAGSLWLGPLGDRHDFRVSNHSLEVKSTIRLGNNIVDISSIEQLEIPQDGDLHLIHFTLERVPRGLLSVSALAEEAIRKSNDPKKIRTLLELLGCSDIHSSKWNAVAFRLEQERVYAVTEDFPRLAPSMLEAGSLRDGIVALSYQIDIAAAVHFQIPPQEFPLVERRMINCLLNG